MEMTVQLNVQRALETLQYNLDFVPLRGKSANRKVYIRVAMIWVMNQIELKGLNHWMLFVNTSYHKSQPKAAGGRESGSSENFKHGFLDLWLYRSTEQV